MRLNQLISTPRISIREPAGRTRAATRLPHLYVGEVEGIEADRERSTRDELDAASELPAANDEINRQEHAEEAARQLRRLGPSALKLLSYQQSDQDDAPHIDAVA